ncbi:hypothetical protein HAX54_020209, partial [Datura stramonium]|nr:hypothetical protein [Datura stramonium]
LPEGKNLIRNFFAKSFHEVMEFGGSSFNHFFASPNNETGKRFPPGSGLRILEFTLVACEIATSRTGLAAIASAFAQELLSFANVFDVKVQATVDFVMEILSKLVIRQVWRMPKLWVGFLKCVSQTQPHSFPVLLQLPPPQLESALNKYANLRSPLVAFANQPNVKASLPRSTLVQLGLFNEPSLQQPHLSSTVCASETGASVHGTT